VTVGVRVTEGVQVGNGVHLDQTLVGVGVGSAQTTRQPEPGSPQVHGETVGAGGAPGVSTAGGVGVGAWARADATGSRETISERDT
jgi:hypothetical protein